MNFKLAVILLFPTVLHAQSLWRAGIVKTNDGQQIEGSIYDFEWLDNPSEIEFRPDGSSSVVKYSVNDIAEFSTDRPVKYRSMEVEYDGDEQQLNKLPFDKNPTLVKNRVFLEVLVDGNPALFLFTDHNKRKHFFIQDDQPIRELLNRMYGIQNNPSLNAWYKQQIILITNNCERVQRSALNLKYNEQDLVNAIIKINGCRGSAIGPVWSGERKKRPLGYGGVVFDAALTNIEFSFYKSSFGRVNSGVGAFFEFLDKRRPNRISYYNEVSYRKIRQSGKNVFNMPTPIEMERLKFLHSVRFSYPNGGGERFYWGLGIIHGLRMNTVIPSNYYQDLFGDFEKDYELGLSASTGHSFKVIGMLKANAELRYMLDEWHIGDSDFVRSHTVSANLQLYLRR